MAKERTGIDQDRFAKWELALQLLNEAVAEAGIQDLTDYRGEEPLLRWSAYKQVTNADVVLNVCVKSQLGSLRAEISLIDAAVTFMDEARRRLNLPRARDVFEISSKEELEEAICNVARSLLARYVSVLPQTLYESLHQAGNDSVRGYVKSVVEPVLRTHWSGDLPGKPGDREPVLDLKLTKSDERLVKARRLFAGIKLGTPKGKRDFGPEEKAAFVARGRNAAYEVRSSGCLEVSRTALARKLFDRHTNPLRKLRDELKKYNLALEDLIK